jgi:hypothetical protein
VVNEAFADKYWPEGDAVGRFIEVARNEYGLLEVVGVVESAPVRGQAVPPPPTYFVPLRGLPRDNMGLFVRVEGAPVDYVDRVREAVWSVDSSQPIERVHTMTALVDDAVALPRLARSLVADRRAELGVRMAPRRHP